MAKRDTLILAIGISLSVVIPAQSRAQLITFEDLTVENSYVPQGYSGFSWLGGLGADSWVLATASSGNLSRPVSGSNNAWSNGPSSLELSRATPFDFTSAYLSVVNGPCSGVPSVQETVHGFFAGVEIFTTPAYTISCTTMAQYVLGFTGVDKVVFETTGPTATMLIDDIQIGRVTVTPEPASLALFATGLISLYGAVRHRQRNSDAM